MKQVVQLKREVRRLKDALRQRDEEDTSEREEAIARPQPALLPHYISGQMTVAEAFTAFQEKERKYEYMLSRMRRLLESERRQLKQAG